MTKNSTTVAGTGAPIKGQVGQPETASPPLAKKGSKGIITIVSSNGQATFNSDGALLATDIDTEFPPIQLDVKEWRDTYPDEDPVGQSHDILDWSFWFYQGLDDNRKPSFGYELAEADWRKQFLYTTWILDPTDPRAIQPPGTYDKLEISPVLDTEGHTEVLHEPPPENRVHEVYWSLYGHIPGKGVETIGDFKSRGHAYAVACRLGYSK